MSETRNPSEWRYTWEAQSHVPLLRLYIFNTTTTTLHLPNLNLNLILHQFLLNVSWSQNQQQFTLRVPVPRVLIDVDADVKFRVLTDHVEVKFALLLPVDHPVFANLGDDDNVDSRMDSDHKKLSSLEEVQFYCKNCSAKLTESLRFFEEMPSINWREAADNWFGACCCSFGGISEMLVASYAKLYTSKKGVCLLNTSSVVLCKDDFVGCRFADPFTSQKFESSVPPVGHSVRKEMIENGSEEGTVVARVDCEVSEEVSNADPLLQTLKDVESDSSYSDETSDTADGGLECCFHACGLNPKQKNFETIEPLANQKSFLNGFLGNNFMARSAYISKDIQWIEFLCPKCSCPLGAYPQDNDDVSPDGNDLTAPLDRGVHLFKCCISTSNHVGGSSDLFWQYTLEKMFTSQLLESAKDELSFRTVVKDMQNRSPMLQVVLLNPNSWCSTGECLGSIDPIPKLYMYPTIKLLFSDCSNSTKLQARMIEKWIAKNQADDIFMWHSQIRKLVESLQLGNSRFPFSHASLQDLSLSFLKR